MRRECKWLMCVPSNATSQLANASGMRERSCMFADARGCVAVCVCVCAPVFYCPINNAPTLLACQPYSTIVYNRKMADYCLILRIMERVCVNAIASQAA